MRRLGGERGAVAVIVAILAVVLFGFAALAIDVSNMTSDRKQLQNGADAGALAIAQGCAGGDCGDTSGIATSMAVLNRNDGQATGQVVSLDLNAGSVTVRTNGPTDHWFAPVLGVTSTGISTEATAVWEPLGGGTATMPLAFSLCEIVALAESTGDFTFVDGQYQIADEPSGTEVTILLSKTTETEGCYPEPSGNWLPGGFGWLDTDGTCSADVQADGSASSDTGVDVPKDCSVDYLASLVGTTIALPIFDQALVEGTGTNATYHILGWVGFHVTGYSFVGQYKENAPCGGNDRCVSGYFDELVELDAEAGDYLTDLGARTVRLTH